MDSITSTPDAVYTPTLLFRVGEAVYGCDITEAQEIIPLRAATRLPGAPAYVRGLINVRGTIVTVLDLGVRLDATRAPLRDGQGSIVLLRYRDRLVGVAVNEVVDVRALPADDAACSNGAGPIVRGMATLDGRPVVLLDFNTLITQVLLS